MDEFFKMDVFFVVATIGFGLMALLLCIALAYVIRLLQTLNRVADAVEDEAKAMKSDLDDARQSIKNGSNSLLAFLGFAGKTGKRLMKKKKRAS